MNSSKYLHFLITRFNLKTTWIEDKNGVQINTEDWLADRYELFLKYCFSSVKNQVNSNFIWLVYFDSETPKKYKVINNELKAEFQNFTPIYKESYNKFVTDLGSDIKKHIDYKDLTHVITTRLDNDDALHKDAITEIQGCFNYQSFGIIDLINGYNYRISNTKSLTERGYKLNPFISLVEKLENGTSIKTVYDTPHNEWRTLEYKPNTKKRLWMQIIHEKNISNKLWGRPIFNVYEKDAFPFLIDLNTKSIINIFKYRLREFLKRSKLS